MNTKKIRQIYGIVLSLALAAAAVCLIVACWNIYHMGGQYPYNAKRVAEAFAPIAVPVYLALALSVGSLFLPGKPEKQKMEKNYPLMLEKLHQKNDFEACGDSNLVEAIRRQQGKRKRNAILSWGLLALGTLVFLWYSLDSTHIFSKDSHEITRNMGKGALVMLLCLGVPFGFGIYAAYAHKASICREWELMKLVAVPCEKSAAEVSDKKWLPYVQLSLFAIALVMIIGGAVLGGWRDVLTKAVNICRECVGLG